jgi:hypothetical protein
LRRFPDIDRCLPSVSTTTALRGSPTAVTPASRISMATVHRSHGLWSIAPTPETPGSSPLSLMLMLMLVLASTRLLPLEGIFPSPVVVSSLRVPLVMLGHLPEENCVSVGAFLSLESFPTRFPRALVYDCSFVGCCQDQSVVLSLCSWVFVRTSLPFSSSIYVGSPNEFSCSHASISSAPLVIYRQKLTESQNEGCFSV